MHRWAVLGAGGWGTAFALLLADAGREVTLWSRRPEQVAEINHQHTNRTRLAGVELPRTITAAGDAGTAVAAADAVVVALPAQTVRGNLTGLDLPPVPVLSLAKGLEVGTGLRMSEVLVDCGVDPARIAALSGPNLADEIGRREPASAVIAASDHDLAVALQQGCHGPNFRPYSSVDLVGVEVGGATKNAIAVAVGMAIGLGVGANSIAALITRGLAETTRLGEALGADPLTFSGMAGMGDLVATCFSPLSRNRTFGEQLGRGLPAAEAQARGRGVVEAVRSTPAIADLAARHRVDMPIVAAVCEVLRGDLTPEDGMRRTMERAAKPER